MIWLTGARHVRDFLVHVDFSDGTTATLDLRDHLRGAVFEALRDPAVFAALRFDPEVETIVWPNGADFAPEFLHDLATARAVPDRSGPVVTLPGR